MKISLASRLLLGAGLLAAVPVALWAQSDEDRRRAVGDWLVEDVAEQDGARIIHLTREEGDYRIDYHLWLRPGAARFEAHGFEVDRLNCAHGIEESIGGGGDIAPEAAPVRAHLVDDLGHCSAPPGDVAHLLEGYERAFALARQWAEERLAELATMDPAIMTSSEANAVDETAADMNAVEFDDGTAMDMNMDETNAMSAAENAADAAANAAEAAANAAAEPH